MMDLPQKIDMELEANFLIAIVVEGNLQRAG